MLADVGDDEKVARLTTKPSAVALLRNADPRTRVDSGWDPDLYLFGLRRCSLAVAQRARRPSSPGAIAIGTGLRKLESSASSHDLARAFACGARYDRSARIARAQAPRTLLASIDRDVCRKTCERFFEAQRQWHLDVTTTLWHWRRRLGLGPCAATGATEEIRENVAET